MFKFFPILSLLFLWVPYVSAQELVPDEITYVKAEVLEVQKQEIQTIPGTDRETDFQVLRVRLLEGAEAGKIVTIENDYLSLRIGERFYVMHIYSALDERDYYSVSDPYRIPTLALFGLLFLACLFLFGGKQGIRGLLALVASLFFIFYLLLPGILAGYSPILVALGVASVIIVAGSYITHGFNRTTTAAVIGMLITIGITGLLAYFAIDSARLTGYADEESVYLSFNTRGVIDFVGLLLGGLLIGLLGVLYDAAISQAIAVEELWNVGPHLTRREVYKRGLRIGREHIGALVNTLAIAYVGASLPLLLLFSLSSSQNLITTINQELFATELLRTMIGSTGLILAVPITTLVAVYMLHGRISSTEVTHKHHH